ncbi:hypothetical protein [Taibaiella koreensis]|uniref:hypothetical protein n=1 Tax=Taibaiella koreensis TaxID=1268548 RepID=UPI0013C350E4|nr:hypothetical protein [Taibaiella koreensis]
MKIKLGLITGLLAIGISIAAQAQNPSLNWNTGGSEGPWTSIHSANGTVQNRPVAIPAELYLYHHFQSPMVSTVDPSMANYRYAFRYDGFYSQMPIYANGSVIADSLKSRHTTTAKYFIGDSLRINGRISGNSLIADSISIRKLNLIGNLGLGMPADLSGVTTNTPDPDIDRMAIRGSMIAYLGTSDASSGASYKMLKLHNAKSATTHSWHVGFSANTNTNGSGYQELVQLRTRKTASGPVFSIAADNAGTMTDRLKVMQNGNIAIGLDTAVERLAVNGKVKATGFVTDASSFPDYVFAPAYQLRSIDALAGYVQEHQKLPGMPSEKEVQRKGLNLAEVSIATVEKVEELSLYIIQLNDRIRQLEAKLATVDK